MIENKKIFIAISSWRDPFILNTIKSAVSNADRPELLSFGCVFQGYDYDKWMIEGIHELHSNISIKYLDANSCSLYLCELRGKISEELFKDEDFYLQIDSHGQFTKSWDTLLKQEFYLANKKFGKSIITGNSFGFRDWDAENNKVIHNNSDTVVPDEEIFQKIGTFTVGKRILKKPNTQMLESMMHAGFRFSDSEYIKKVKQPSNILFDYEQPIMSLKTYTAGYNMVSSAHMFMFVFDWPTATTYMGEPISNFRHRREKDPLWEKPREEIRKKQREVFYNIITNPIKDTEFSLYSDRSIDEYMDFAGFDIFTLRVSRKFDDDFLYQSNRINIIDIDRMANV